MNMMNKQRRILLGGMLVSRFECKSHIWPECLFRRTDILNSFFKARLQPACWVWPLCLHLLTAIHKFVVISDSFVALVVLEPLTSLVGCQTFLDKYCLFVFLNSCRINIACLSILSHVREFLTTMKNLWWPTAVVSTMVGLLSLWHIPHFHSQFYYSNFIE